MWWTRLNNFLKRPASEQWLFFQAYWMLGIARGMIKFVSFRRLAGQMGQTMAEPAPAPAPGDVAHVRRVAWAVNRAAALTPWESNCFPQALAAKFLLRRAGIASTLYLGLAIADEESSNAHAWLRCGTTFVTGRAGHDLYRVVATFT